MGWFGCGSDESDQTLDIIDDYVDFEDEKYRPKRADMIKCLDEAYDSKCIGKSLGVVMWFVKQEFNVPKKYLVLAIKMAEDELNGENNGWDNFEERKIMLKKEIEMMKFNLLFN